MKYNTYYNTCAYCGANLDPGEKCDCYLSDKYINKFKEKATIKIDEIDSNKQVHKDIKSNMRFIL